MAITAPWSGCLRYLTPITTALIFINTLIISILAIITVADLHYDSLNPNNVSTGSAYLNSHRMLFTAYVLLLLSSPQNTYAD